MHVPKTSGWALRQGLEEAVSPKNPVPQMCLDRVLFDGFDDFESFQPHIRSMVFRDSAELPDGVDFICGHMAFSTLLTAYPQAQFFTVLREPISRILSHWLFWRSWSEKDIKQWGTHGSHVLMARRPLHEFLSRGELACQVDNLVTRMLLWPHKLIHSQQFIDERDEKTLLMDALARLRRFSFADVVENPDFVTSVSKWLQKPFRYGRVNEASRVPEPFRTSLQDELSEETLQLLDRRTRLDVKLWLAAARLHLVGQSPHLVRQHALVRNIARFSALLGTGGD
ncbi:MAG TPA: hypothetical protein VGD78_18930 [Chthoniobacterales bacterium]